MNIGNCSCFSFRLVYVRRWREERLGFVWRPGLLNSSQLTYASRANRKAQKHRPKALNVKPQTVDLRITNPLNLKRHQKLEFLAQMRYRVPRIDLNVQQVGLRLRALQELGNHES